MIAAEIGMLLIQNTKFFFPYLYLVVQRRALDLPLSPCYLLHLITYKCLFLLMNTMANLLILAALALCLVHSATAGSVQLTDTTFEHQSKEGRRKQKGNIKHQPALGTCIQAHLPWGAFHHYSAPTPSKEARFIHNKAYANLACFECYAIASVLES